MNRFHRLALATLAALALISSDAARVDAHPIAPARPAAAPPQPSAHAAYYRPDPNGPWYRYGTYRDAYSAYYVALVLRYWGYDSFYR